MCRNRNPVLFSFMTCHLVCNKNRMGATCGIGSAYPSEAPEFTHGLQLGACCWIFSFYVVFVDHHFLLACVLSVLRFTASDYLFDIFKLFLVVVLKLPTIHDKIIRLTLSVHVNGSYLLYDI